MKCVTTGFGCKSPITVFMSTLKKIVPVGVLFTLCLQINNNHSSKLDIVFCDCGACIFVALMCHL